MSIISSRTSALGINYGEYDSARERGTLPAEEQKFWILYGTTGWLPKDFVKIVDLLNNRKTATNMPGEFKINWDSELHQCLADLIIAGYSQTDIAQTIQTHTGISVTKIANQMPKLRSSGLIPYTPRKRRMKEATNNPADIASPEATLDFDKMLDESFAEVEAQSSTSSNNMKVISEPIDFSDSLNAESVDFSTPYTAVTASVISKAAHPAIPQNVIDDASSVRSSIELDAAFDISNLSSDPMYLLEVLKKMIKSSINADSIVSLSASCETGCTEVRYRLNKQIWSVKISLDPANNTATKSLDSQTSCLEWLKELGVNINEFKTLLAKRIERTKKSFTRDYLTQVGLSSDDISKAVDALF